MKKKKLNKLYSCIVAIVMVVTYLGVNNIYAKAYTILSVNSSQFMEVDSTDPNQINVYADAEKTALAGSFQVKLNDAADYLTPLSDEGKLYFITAEDSHIVNVELMPSRDNDYIAPNSYSFGNNTMPLASTNISLTLTNGITNELSFDFIKSNGNQPPAPGGNEPGPGGNEPGPMQMYPIIAEFEDAEEPEVITDENNTILIPEQWNSGKVTFKARIFTKTDGTVEPFCGQTEGGISGTVDLEIEGIANGQEIDGTVMGSIDRKSVTVNSEFNKYGKLQLHLVSELEADVQVNQMVNIIHEDMISIKAEAEMSLSQSFGTVALNSAIITQNVVKNVNVFFGNDEVILAVSGDKVDKITAVDGGDHVLLNEDGTATITLPGLNTETTTQVVVKILKKDGTSIDRTINIVRTAIQLQHTNDLEGDFVYAGYVVNKAYLYNNLAHNDEVFNAYFQVILYKDDVVAGYKQIKIDDEELVNRLENNMSSSIELFSDLQIPIYGPKDAELMEGINKVSVFLTNGPIDFNGDSLPSVEFGIGSGVTCEWEELS